MISKINYKMRSRVFAALILTGYLLFIGCTTAAGLIFEGAAQAQSGSRIVFYWNSDDEAYKDNLVEEVRDGFNETGNDIQQTKIIVENGPGGKDMVLNYDVESNKKFNTITAERDDYGEYFYSKTLYCTVGSSKITDTRPNEEHIRMLYTMSIRIGKGDDAEKALTEWRDYKGDNSHAGVTKAERVKVSSSGGEDAVDQIYDMRRGHKGTNDINEETGKIDPGGCRPNPRSDVTIENYAKLSAADKKKYKELIDKLAGDESGNTEQNENPDCDVKLTSILSWIICPVVELGTAFTDWVFTQFVRGLLEDVPIEASNDNGSYRAWKQFRLLGNVVLVGTLMAVVYSQARGGK